MGTIKISVKCYSGYKGSERPISFSLGSTLHDVQVLDSWYGPDYTYFKVRADDDNLYILRHDEKADQWELEFFSAL